MNKNILFQNHLSKSNDSSNAEIQTPALKQKEQLNTGINHLDKKLLIKIKRKIEEKKKILDEQEIYRKISND